LKLCDFGLAKLQHATLVDNTCIGSYQTSAPEMLEGRAYTEKSDTYSFAIVCWELLTGDAPFAKCTPIEVMERVVGGQRLQLPSRASLSSVEAALVDLIVDCWHQQPAMRPSFVDIVKRLDSIR
jgi:serine/threonine protein kinase